MSLVVYITLIVAQLINSNLIVGIFFQRYLQGKTGWYLYDLDSHKFFYSWHVRFLENKFPFNISNSTPTVAAEVNTSGPAHLLFDDMLFDSSGPYSFYGPGTNSLAHLSFLLQVLILPTLFITILLLKILFPSFAAINKLAILHQNFLISSVTM